MSTMTALTVGSKLDNGATVLLADYFGDQLAAALADFDARAAQ